MQKQIHTSILFSSLRSDVVWFLEFETEILSIDHTAAHFWGVKGMLWLQYTLSLVFTLFPVFQHCLDNIVINASKPGQFHSVQAWMNKEGDAINSLFTWSWAGSLSDYCLEYKEEHKLVVFLWSAYVHMMKNRLKPSKQKPSAMFRCMKILICLAQ